jgi:hypothetical protein
MHLGLGARFVRNYSVLLSFGFVKAQELIGWSHSDTDGTFQSCCSAIELVGNTVVDAVYVIVERYVNGQYIQFIERFDDRMFIYGAEDSWSVDAGLRTLFATGLIGLWGWSKRRRANYNSLNRPIAEG